MKIKYPIAISQVLLTMLGVIPFFLLIIYIEKYNYFDGILYFKAYSALIVSFVAATHWGYNLTERKELIFILSIIPFLIAFLAFFINFDVALKMLIFAHCLNFFLDFFQFKNNKDQKIYLVLRFIITVIVVFTHVRILI